MILGRTRRKQRQQQRMVAAPRVIRLTQPELTISIRLLWPYARLMAGDPRAHTLLTEMGIGPSDMVFDQRLTASVTFRALDRAVELFDDPTLGLRAGKLTDQGTFGVLDHGAACAKDLRAAIEFFIRYFCVISEASEAWLAVEGERAHFWYAPRVPHPNGANDLLISAAIEFARRHCDPRFTPQEVWLMHERPSYVDAYAEHWGIPVRFGMHANAIVFDAAWLDRPMRAASKDMAIVFERKAATIAAGLTRGGTLTRRVRERLNAQLVDGSLDMADVARALKVSTATLRRRLDEEGSAFSDILDSVRKEAAERYLLSSELTVTEIAHRLGFSHVRAFARAFRRWTGKTPSDFREADTQ